MSGSIITGFGILPTLMRNVDQITAQEDALTNEASSEVISGSFAGLGDQTYTALSLEPQITANAAWQSNVSTTQTNLSVAQDAMSSISTIASNLQTSLTTLQTNTEQSSVTAIADTAKQELTQLTSLLNTQSGDTYVFAGEDSSQAPVSSGDLASSGLVSSIMTAVSQVGTAGAAATESATLAAAMDNSASGSVFSTALSTTATTAATQVQTLQVGQSETLSTGVVATQGGASSADSTGSPIRDLIRALATVAGLSDVDTSSTEYTQLVTDTSNQMQSVSSGIQDLVSTLGGAQSAASTQSNILSDTSTALQSQLNTAVDCDPATVSTQLKAVQNQLTASYTLIADMKTLTLAQYL